MAGVRMRRALGAAAVVLALARLAGGADLPALVLARWVVLGANGGASARAVTTASTCPPLVVDGAPVAMAVRAAPSPAHPVRTCEAALPRGARVAAVAGLPLPLPVDDPERIVVLGETGCRLVHGPEPMQACNDAAAWPAAAIAAAATRDEPQLVIHTGDLVGRLTACRPGTERSCGGSPSGDTFATWHADVLAPEAPLLAAAPWIVARGDHDRCGAAGDGFLRYFAPGPRPKRCPPRLPPYLVMLGALQLQVLDTSGADDDGPAPAAVDATRRDLAVLRELIHSPAWLLTHRPVWAVRQQAEGLATPTRTLQVAIGDGLEPAIHTILSGHVRLFEHLAFAAQRPQQVVVGNGAVHDVVAGTRVDGALVAQWDAAPRFGYLVLQRVGKEWDARAKDETGRVIARFTLR
jgi:hypothetical protein